MRHLGQTKDRIDKRCKSVESEISKMQHTRHKIKKMQRKMVKLEEQRRDREAAEGRSLRKNDAALSLGGSMGSGPSLLSRVSYVDKVEISEEDQQLRDIAKQYGLHLPVVEKLKAMFDKFDTYKSGDVGRAEFDLMYRELENIPPGMEIPTRFIDPAWKKVDIDESGSISFEEFLCLAADLGLLEWQLHRAGDDKSYFATGNNICDLNC